jgi:hypothetical protein
MSKRKDISGQIFGKLTALKFKEFDGKNTFWECMCSCGNNTTCSYRNLKSGTSKSCGCLRSETQIIDLINKKFNRLTVLKFVELKKSGAYWECLCDCGKKKIICGSLVANNKIKSCGCLQLENLKKAISTHSLTKTSEYKTWKSIISRCKNKNNPWYGSKNIKICEKWKNSFEEFYKDMGKRPSDTHSIDRIDSNKDYTPENCKWSTDMEQSNNRCSNVKIINKETNEIYPSISQAAKAIGMKTNTLTSKLLGVVKNDTNLEKFNN